MAVSTTTCCVAVLNQQQQVNTSHHNQLANQSLEDASTNLESTKPKYCTVVENGRVIVKPIVSD